MHSKVCGILLSALALTSFAVSPGNCAPTKATASKGHEYPKVMTGFDTHMSIQIKKCIRAHVPGYGTNQVVVLQYILRKEGPNPAGSPPYDKDKFWPRDIKARDPALAQAFKVWQQNGDEETASAAFWTDEWKPGQNGEGYVWLNIPERVKVIDVYFPYTNPQRVEIEIPKA